MTVRTKKWLQTKIGRDLSRRGLKKVTEYTYSTYQYLKDIIDSCSFWIPGGNITAENITTTGETPLTMNDTVWDDLRAPFTQIRRGALDKPDFDYTNIGLLFPQNDAAEIIYIIFQMPHNYKLGTNIYPHIHWQQMNGNSVVWKLEYKWFNKGGLVPAGFTAVTANSQRYTWSAGNLHQYDSWAALSGAAINELSSVLLIKVFRDDNVDAGAGGGDALAFEFDVHYQLDTIGSKTEFDK